LGKSQVAVHFFDFYEHYTGSFMPKEYLLAGQLQVQQTAFYADKKKRLALAQLILEGASFNMLKVLRYYDNRDKNVSDQILQIETHRNNLS
jgi:CRISPR-associated protein Cas1